MDLRYESNSTNFLAKGKGLIAFLLFVCLWQGATYLSMVSLSSPVAVGQAFVRGLFETEPIMGRTLCAHAAMSFVRICVGSGCAFMLAVCVGTLFGCYKNAREFGTVLIELLRPVPPIAWVPVSIILFGRYGHFFVVFVGAFFPCFICVYEGVCAVDREWIDLGRIAQVSDKKVIAKIIFPAVLPSIIRGIRIGAGVAWMCIIAAEMISFSSAGLGYYIMVMHDVGHTANMLAGMVMIGLIGYLISKIFSIIMERCSYVR